MRTDGPYKEKICVRALKKVGYMKERQQNQVSQGQIDGAHDREAMQPMNEGQVDEESCYDSDLENLLSAQRLPADHYRVQVTNDPLPPLTVLKQIFSEKGVAGPFDGQEWKRHKTRLEMELPGERIFWVANPPIEVARKRQQIIDWAESLGYQVAVETEAVAFANAYPHVQRCYFLIAYGSTACRGPNKKRCVTMLSACTKRRELVGIPVDSEIVDFCRVLLVRKGN
jgi:hypothetical protein